MESNENIVCRLCAKSYLLDEIIGQIDNESLEIEVKLVMYCQWAKLNHPQSVEMPKNVCISCFQKLQQSCDFAEQIRNVQSHLLSQLLSENKLEMESDDNQDILSNESENLTGLVEFETNPDSESKPIQFGDVYADSIFESSYFKTEDDADIFETKPILVNESVDIPAGEKSIPYANNFLDSISKDDRNRDGTIRPEAIERLKLGNWTLLQHQCHLCPLQFPDYCEWRDHIQTVHPETPIKHVCTICNGKVYSTREPLKRHIANNHQRHLKYW